MPGNTQNNSYGGLRRIGAMSIIQSKHPPKNALKTPENDPSDFLTFRSISLLVEMDNRMR